MFRYSSYFFLRPCLHWMKDFYYAWSREITILHVPTRTSRTHKSSHSVPQHLVINEPSSSLWGLNLYDSSQYKKLISPRSPEWVWQSHIQFHKSFTYPIFRGVIIMSSQYLFEILAASPCTDHLSKCNIQHITYKIFCHPQQPLWLSRNSILNIISNTHVVEYIISAWHSILMLKKKRTYTVPSGLLKPTLTFGELRRPFQAHIRVTIRYVRTHKYIPYHKTPQFYTRVSSLAFS